MAVSRKPLYRVISSRVIHEGYIARLVRDRFILRGTGGKVWTRETLVHPGAVVILPFLDPRRIILLRQFRFAASGFLWEIPAGTRESGEREIACARRELEEETGYRARRWRLLTRFLPAPGISTELMTLYRAESLVPGRKDLDHDEWIEHRVVTLAQACRMVRDGRIRDGKTIAAVLWARLFG